MWCESDKTIFREEIGISDVEPSENDILNNPLMVYVPESGEPSNERLTTEFPAVWNKEPGGACVILDVNGTAEPPPEGVRTNSPSTEKGTFPVLENTQSPCQISLPITSPSLGSVLDTST